MDTLQQDLGKLSIGKKSGAGSFLDIVGADSDSSYDKPMTVQVVQDTYHISVGGQTVGENANIQIQIDDDNCIHYLHKYGIVADLYVDHCIIENAAMLFDGLEMSIGNVTWSCSFQRYYAQQKLSKLGKSKMEQVSSGLLLKHDGFSQTPTSTLGIFVGTGNATNEPIDSYQLLVRQLRCHYIYNECGDFQNSNRVKIYVPLPLIFPTLWELPDDGAIATTLGQKLKFNLRTCQASQCCLNVGGGASNYSLQNVSLIRFYSKLDPIRADLLLKSTVQLPCLKYIHWQQSVLQPVVNAIFGISAKDRIRGLIFGFHSNIPSQSAADNTNDNGNLVNATAAQFKYPLGYFPYMPIQQIDIDIGGHTYNINMTQLQFIHLSNYLGDQKETYNFPLQRQGKFAYYLDLTRFGFSEDMYGSSSKNITSVHIQLTMKTGAGSRTLTAQTDDWDAATFANFGFFGYLETQQMFECRQGIYSMV